MSSSFQFTSSRLQTVQGGDSAGDDDEDDHFDEDAPLLSSSGRLKGDSAFATGGYGSSEHRRSRPQSQRDSSRSSSRRKHLRPFFPQSESYNVNYPPSVPGSPPMRPTERSGLNFGDALLRDEIAPEGSPRRLDSRGDLGESDHSPHISPIQRRHTIALQAEEDVCFPQEGLSELGDDEANVRDGAVYRGGRGRRRRGRWPDLGILDEWSRLEKEGRSDERRAKKITEPQLINGRLRPVHKGWYRAEEDAPYRFTYFNEEFQSTIHSQTISELVQPGGSFKELFLPDPPILSDSSDDEEEELGPDAALHYRSIDSLRNGETKVPTRQSSLLGQLHHNSETLKEGHMSPTKEGETSKTSQKTSGTATPGSVKSPATEKATLHEQPEKPEKPTRYGERPVWWLDVLSPTEAEMKVLSKAFGIHPLTAEDIMMQEAREKVELFRHYYLVNYRSFDQDQSSENFLEPVNVYVVVFREGVISFHFSMTPHPANVRRRVRQLRDYMILSADWISYAIIDDITDVFVPLIQNIEEEVDDIDDAILRLHSSSDPASSDHNKKDSEKRSDGAGESSSAPESGADMLRRVGDCRKKVMMLYRLLGNKADVIKGFAKRCNEHWEVAPRSEIGLYLGDIQDHIVTMTANLSHYEKILARSHGNYLAQINIRMNERQEQTADVLGRLTVLGTIVLPMNIITGLWGMNVWVPGQEWEGDLKWFWAITAGLLCFGLACYAIAKRVYKIV
ncbi:uncharacterized protein E0L32_011633 [Thyridium curvatum]|uniref:Uncharacterized protein n=1 Tax=Thyridium curvatum TaxID=1093900 RepID=A0A507BNS7_9PEZI|nr:uncharacterized protein E0L32_011633 [Thyridium curvatum]TPX18448.1 hypothetical protein E0L32_011633 [Thyridium curvatum]